MAKKRGKKKRVIKKSPKRSPGRIIASMVAFILIIAFVSLAVSLLQKPLAPIGVTLAPYVSEYVTFKDYVPKLKLSDPALEINAGEMAEVVMFVGNNKEIQKDILLDVTCEARTTQGCAFIDLTYEHLVSVAPDTVEAYPLQITTTDKVKPGEYDIIVVASMNGKTYDTEFFMLDVK
ncbi:MAG: hypothetical protein KAT43_06450 [Nanoarchaeota archaeon]|nr:hypothetical protein [Nanoarchaeota archaeon]